MLQHYEDLLDAGVGELKFEKMQVEALYDTLDEITSFANDNLAKKVAENAKERHQLDKLIHARLIFTK